ncbi:guanine nucleotide-binding protein subunit alpha [Anaeramoeba ignava]|uniref:Guanine nucleotide-binding protein subunit alpha n=1 Tax=Anaeramoeba ignava TaxID=1746090 RepID=A0A9Q0RI70_ANAIG|nr:guanine nucleotide-binding protein subunit alpha [Anaeramoeba ignava]
MGCCYSKDPFYNQEMRRRNKEIESLLHKQKIKLEKETKILLLGAGSTGKSTFFRQVQLLQNGNFNQETVIEFRQIISRNCISLMKKLCSLANNLNIEIKNKFDMKKLDKIPNNKDFISQEDSEIIKNLWNDSGIQKIYPYAKLQLESFESAVYFFQNIDRISNEYYSPTNEDIIHARYQTRSIQEEEFTIKGYHFRLVDVGGQRSQRRKWIHCFEGTTSVIFFVSLTNCFQQKSKEQKISKLQESLDIFQYLVSCPWFERTTVVIFFNKLDLFKELLSDPNNELNIPSYQGSRDFTEVTEYIVSLFLNINSSSDYPSRDIYHFLTCAIDSDKISSVFLITLHSLFERSLEDLDF